MKLLVKRTVEVEIDVAYVTIDLPVDYGDEDMPIDFPCRNGDRWNVTVDMATGQIRDWPSDVDFDLFMKVGDDGCYTLYSVDGTAIACIDGYVPHGVIPGENGDYVNLEIGNGGRITNWPKKPDVSKFFES